jgi:hypothetical protein
MKKFVIVVMVAVAALWGGLVFAGEGVEVEVGVKAWYNKWTNDDPAFGKIKFDPTFLVGPAIEVKFPNHLFVEASYLLSVSDYTKEEGGDKLSSDRKDLDLTIGYNIVPSFGVFVGYKSVSMDWKLTGTTMDNGSLDLTGPMIGIRGSYEMNKMFALYGSATYLFTELKSTDTAGSTTEDAPGTIFELGVKAAFNKQLSGTLGYKVESTKEDKTNIKDTFAGVTLGVMYAFH